MPPRLLFPQGRNITQYQFIDDFSWTHGNHTFKFGENFRRYDISDHNFFINSPLVYWGYSTNFLQSFAEGVAYQYRRNDNQSTNVPIATWGIGVYGQDEWKATRNLKLTLALRVERNSNPVCQTNCFSNLTGPFASTASGQAGYVGSFDVPYSSDLNYNQHQAYPGVDSFRLVTTSGIQLGSTGQRQDCNQRRIRGYDNPAAGLVDNLLGNPPSSVSLRIRSADNVTGILPFQANGAPLTWQQSADAFDITQSFNQISTKLSGLGAHFNAPAVGAIVGTIKAPEWQEWNFCPSGVNRSTVLIVNYVGNHGARISYFNAWGNAYDGYGLYERDGAALTSAGNYRNRHPVSSREQSPITTALTFSLRKQFSNWVSGTSTTLGRTTLTRLRMEDFSSTDSRATTRFWGRFTPAICVRLTTATLITTSVTWSMLICVNPTFHKTGALK